MTLRIPSFQLLSSLRRLAFAAGAAGVLLLAGCGDDGDGPGGQPPGDGDGDGDGDQVCTSDYACQNGACSCRTSGVSGVACCDPDVCGATSSSSCEVACEICSGDGDDDGSGADDGSGDGNGGDPCWSACNADHGSCADRCGAGDACWAACNADHGSCADRCGPGAACWSACNADHGTCTERCA